MINSQSWFTLTANSGTGTIWSMYGIWYLKRNTGFKWYITHYPLLADELVIKLLKYIGRIFFCVHLHYLHMFIITGYMPQVWQQILTVCRFSETNLWTYHYYQSLTLSLWLCKRTWEALRNTQSISCLLGASALKQIHVPSQLLYN